MRDERFEVTVTYDARHGYIASAPELRHQLFGGITLVAEATLDYLLSQRSG
jgi:hypothetical protein